MDKQELKTNIILTVNLWEKAKIRAAKERISLSELVRRALKEYLGKKKPSERGGD